MGRTCSLGYKTAGGVEGVSTERLAAVGHPSVSIHGERGKRSVKKRVGV